VVFNDTSDSTANDKVVVVIAVNTVDFFAAQYFKRRIGGCLELHTKSRDRVSPSSLAWRFVMDGVHVFYLISLVSHTLRLKQSYACKLKILTTVSMRGSSS
jgi:hypothetical protein